MLARMLPGAVVLCCASLAVATPYWIAYEGDDLPENVGWTRHYGDEIGFGHGGAVRTIEDGALVIDSRRNQMIFDFAEMNRPIDPEPGELFIAEWRLLVEEHTGYRDTGVTIAGDADADLAIRHTLDSVVNDREGWVVPVAPGQWHRYTVTSLDMQHYEFAIDGSLAQQGTFNVITLNRSFVNFGDMAQGGESGSVAQWDYVRFGVVPEPASGIAIVSVVCALAFGRRMSRVFRPRGGTT